MKRHIFFLIITVFYTLSVHGGDVDAVTKNIDNLKKFQVSLNKSLQILNYIQIIKEMKKVAITKPDYFMLPGLGFADSGLCLIYHSSLLTNQDIGNFDYSFSVENMCNVFRSHSTDSKEDPNQRQAATNLFLNTVDDSIEQLNTIAKNYYVKFKETEFPEWSDPS